MISGWINLFKPIGNEIRLYNILENNIVENNKHLFVIHLYPYCDTIILDL